MYVLSMKIKPTILKAYKIQRITIINGYFTTISGHTFANCIIIHKTEVQMVVLMCLTGLKSDWIEGYDTKSKYFQFCFFCNFVQKRHMRFCLLCHIFCTNKDLDSSSNSKWFSEAQFCEKQTYSWWNNGQTWYKMAIYQLVFFEGLPSRCEASIDIWDHIFWNN